MDWESTSEELRANRGIHDYEPLKPFVAQRTSEKAVWYEGQLVVLYAQGEEVGDTCTVWEGNIPEEVGPPPHIHLYEHELFYIIEGHLRAFVEGVEHDVPQGSLLFLPAGRVHWFVSAAEVTRMLSFTITASRDFPVINRSWDLFELIGAPAEALTLPPEGARKEFPDPHEILRVTQQNGQDMPDLLDAGWRRGFGDGTKHS